MGLRNLAAVRREHDQWARGAALGVTYYTVLPTARHVAGARQSHSSYVFDRRARAGLYTGQLITTTNAPSWALWLENGPLTTDARWTHGQEKRRLEEFAAKFPASAALLGR